MDESAERECFPHDDISYKTPNANLTYLPTSFFSFFVSLCQFPGFSSWWLCSQVDRVFGFKSPLVRFSWSTCKEVLEKSGAVEVTWDCDEEEDGAQQKLWSSYAPARKRTVQGGGVGKRASKHAAAESSGVGRQSFFRSRKLQKIDAF